LEIQYSHGCFNARELIKHLNLTGQGDTVYYELIISREIIKKAQELELKVSTDDIQTCVDNYRVARRLHSAEDTLQFLSRAGLTVEELEQFCDTALLTDAVKDHLADAAKVENYFVNHRSEFDLARISRIVVETENLAREISMQVSEDGEDFHALARMHSVDDTSRYSGGYEGLVSRSAFTPDVSSKVFNAQANDVLGPFKVDKGFLCILLEELIKPELDDRLKGLVREKIFKDWASQFMKAGIQCKT